MKKFLIALMTVVSIGAVASPCTARDAWTGPDKNKHALVGVAMGSAGTLVFKSPEKGLLLGTSIALAKEVYDSRGHGTCSFQDFAVTVMGSAAGAYGTAWIVTPRYVGFAKVF